MEETCKNALIMETADKRVKLWCMNCDFTHHFGLNGVYSIQEAHKINDLHQAHYQKDKREREAKMGICIVCGTTLKQGELVTEVRSFLEAPDIPGAQAKLNGVYYAHANAMVCINHATTN